MYLALPAFDVRYVETRHRLRPPRHLQRHWKGRAASLFRRHLTARL